MNNQKPLEIEYKFLIRYPEVAMLEAQPEYRCEQLCQMYLELPKGLSASGTRCRIRSVRTDDSIKFIKTFKEKVTDMTRIEVESEITAEEFDALSQYAREGYSPICKVRHSFALEGFTYEVDVFPFWDDRAYLEIEVESEDIMPPIPDCIRVIKDVTSDPRYRNSALAQSVITEELPE